MRNVRVDVPDSIFLNRWWEVLMYAVWFLLGMTYSSYFGQKFEDDSYIGLPLLLIAVAIMLGRHAAQRHKKEFEDNKAIAEIVALELASRVNKSNQA